jgi:hypothetical protein
MTTLVAIALVLYVVPQASRSQERGVPGRFVGGVVDGVGQIYVLRYDSLETSNLGEAPKSIPLDARRTLTDSDFRNYGFHSRDASARRPMEQSGEPFLVPCRCCLSHTIQPLGHAYSALCRSHV